MARQASKKCPNCGEKVKDIDLYCENCGMKLKEEEVTKKNVELNNIFNNLDLISIILIVVGIILLIAGIATKIPDKEFSFYTITKYVGGDAYNAIIESSLRGGIIAGKMITKAVYITGGLIISAIGINRIKISNQK